MTRLSIPSLTSCLLLWCLVLLLQGRPSRAFLAPRSSHRVALVRRSNGGSVASNGRTASSTALAYSRGGRGGGGSSSNRHPDENDLKRGDDSTATDWREFRAKLVLQEYGIPTATETEYQQWAYQQELLETGTVLVHQGFDISKPHLTKAVLLVLETTEHETVALILNRPANVTLQEKDFTAILLYGGMHSSFHTGQDQRIYCIHRQSNCADVGQQVLSGLFLTSLEDAKQLQHEDRAVAADFLYISGYETLHTPTIQKGLQTGTWKSITIDALTLQQNLLPDMWTNLLTLTGTPPPPLDPTDEESKIQDQLLQEWMQTSLFHGSGGTSDALAPIPNGAFTLPPHTIQEGDLLRASSLQHAFLFDHQEFHKSLVLILEANDQYAVGALLTLPTTQIEPKTQLPIRFGGASSASSSSSSADQHHHQPHHQHNNDADQDGSDLLYCLHYLGDAVGGRKLGRSSFYICSMDEAMAALNRGIVTKDELLVLQGKVMFPKVNAALDWVSPDAAPDLWSLLSQQQPLGPLSLETNVDIACQTWRMAGGSDGEDLNLFHLGYEAVKQWVTSNLLDDTDDEEQGLRHLRP